MNRRTYIIACLAFVALLICLLLITTSTAHASEPYPNVQIQYNSTECSYAGGYSARACSYPGTVYLESSYLQYDLHYELGHQVDYLWLDDAQRSWLMHNWRLGLRQWDDTQASIDAGNEDGGEGLFPLIYAYCWNHKTDVGYAFSFNWSNTSDPIAKPRVNDCAALRSWFAAHVS